MFVFTGVNEHFFMNLVVFPLFLNWVFFFPDMGIVVKFHYGGRFVSD